MTIVRACLGTVSAILLGVVGCGEPGVTNVAPGAPIASQTPAVGGAKATAPAPTATAPATGTTPVPASSSGAASVTAQPSTAGATAHAGTVAPSPVGPAVPVTAGSVALATAGTAVAPATAGVAAPAPAGAAAPTVAGTTAAAGAMAAAGMACPSGFMCVDPSKDFAGVELHDAAGAKIPFGCQENGVMGDLADCVSNPKTACPKLTNPTCAHVFLGGMDVGTVCAQACTP